MTITPREAAARRRMFRRRRATVLLALVLVVVTAAVLIPRAQAAAAAAEVRKELTVTVDAASAVLDVSSSVVPAEATAALATARDAALVPDASAEEDAASLDVLNAAIAAFESAVADSALAFLGEWSDAEGSTEDALYATLPALREAAPADLAGAVTATSEAAAGVQASAQAYRDQITTAAQASSTQPVGGSVDAQLDYLLAHAEDYNDEEWGDYNSAGGDCVNFASQGLLARGWQMDDAWYSGGAWEASKAWRDTPSMDAYLTSQGLSFATFDDLDRVRVGDVGVFNWGETGPGWDHTMTVSRVVYSPDGPVISFASHNNDGQYRDMPAALYDAASGSSARIYSIP